jgi:3-oxoacyl-[acyl-carrier-protein] synthase II
VTDAGFDFETLDKDRAGVIWGSGIGLETFQIEMLNFAAGDGQNLILSIPKMISDIACGHISIKYGFRGPTATVSACASSTNAIIDVNYIRLGHADVMVTGGSEAAVASMVWIQCHACIVNKK